MFFLLSKLFWLVAQPISLAVLLMIAGLVLVGWRRPGWGLGLGGTGVSVLLVCAYTSLGMVLIAPLEDRFVRPEVMPTEVSAIIMLGGATDGPVSSARGHSELNEAGDRVMETLRLAQLYPTAKVVLTGASGSLGGEPDSEAAIAGRLLGAMGVAPGRLVLEEASRNTAENAQLTGALLESGNGAVMLVTSAFHMPRAMGLFARTGLGVVPWPVDYRGSGRVPLWIDLDSPVLNLNIATVAIREWIGLLVYAGTGRIDAILPAPISQ